MVDAPSSLAIAEKLSEDQWAGSFLSIPNEAEQVVEFKYDSLQTRMSREATLRDVWVKPRQVRCSSRILARNLRRVTSNFGTHCLTICKDDDMVARFRQRIEMHIRDLERFGMAPRVTKSDKNELVFGDLGGSRFIWASAEQAIAGRSFTAHIVHASEVAHWKRNASEILGGILPAVPDPPLGQVDIESTPKGAAGVFYTFSMAARYEGQNLEDEYTLHFIKWWEEPKYADVPTEADLKSFTPSEEEKVLVQTNDLSIGQILWRRRKIREMSKTDTPFDQEYPEDLMTCFLLGGNSYFELIPLRWHMDRCTPPVERKRELPLGPNNSTVKFEGWGESLPGKPAPWITHALDIFELPVAGEAYVIFVDPSEGHKKSDNGAIQVLHAKSRRQVAAVALKAFPNRLAEMACALGYYYNGALLAIERNRISACILRAVDLDYPNLYYDVDEELPDKEAKKAGWYTNRDKRTRVLTELKEDVENYILTLRDGMSVREMFTFEWEQVKRGGDSQWKAQAQTGAMDDRVIALAGANYLADQEIFSPRRKGSESSIGGVPWLGGNQGATRSSAPWSR